MLQRYWILDTGYLPDGLPACGGQAGWMLDKFVLFVF